MTFVDASQQAYGAAVYMRCEYDNDTVTSRLIVAKSKVAASKRKEDTNACATPMTCNTSERNCTEIEQHTRSVETRWTRLIRVHARVRRVLHNMRIRDNRNASMELLPEEIKDAEEEIVRLAQREAFRD